MKFQMHFDVNLPREEVWKKFDSPDNMYKWQPTLKSYEHFEGTPGQPGSKAKLVYEENGRMVNVVETLDAREENNSMVGNYDNAMATTYVDVKFSDLEKDKTRISIDYEFRFKGLFKLMAFMMKGAIKKRNTEDMNRFVAMAEGRLEESS